MAWFARRGDGWEADAEHTLAAQEIPVERVDPSELYPSLRADDLAFALLEPEAGVLRSQRAVRTLVSQAEGYGAHRVRGRARPDGAAVLLEDGSWLEGDAVVWACGPWLGDLFSPLVSLRVTRQEVLFFDGGPEWREGQPAWVDYDGAMYGTADIDGHGFKASLDLEGPAVSADDEMEEAGATEPQVRTYLSERFPALADAPLAAARSCRYELTPDTRFIAAPHPEQERVWLIGGGSGHGFKHGPAMAEVMAAALRDEAPLPDRFGLGQRDPLRSLRTAGS